MIADITIPDFWLGVIVGALAATIFLLTLAYRNRP